MTCFDFFPKGAVGEKQCMDCVDFFGRCGKGEKNRLASNPACNLFTPKKQGNTGFEIQSIRTCGSVSSSTLPEV
ncbi:MAG: hypothetical protein ABSA79_10445 [Candidatus Bathyarchaeia archaeon]